MLSTHYRFTLAAFALFRFTLAALALFRSRLAALGFSALGCPRLQEFFFVWPRSRVFRLALAATPLRQGIGPARSRRSPGQSPVRL
jgi:hypothetical protein